MTFYIAAALAWACPGGWLSGLIPAAARPLVCQAKPQIELLDRLPAAEARIRVLGPGSRLLACHGFRCKDVPVLWTTTPEFEEGS